MYQNRCTQSLRPQGLHLGILLFVASTLFGGLGLQRAAAQAGNNNFTNRWVLAGASVTTNGTTAGATLETGIGEDNTPGTTRIGATVWYSWTAPATGNVRMDTVGSGFDTVLAAYTGTALNALTFIAANNGSGNSSLISFNASQGTVYQIQLGGNRPFGGTTASGSYVLNIAMLPSATLSSPQGGATIAPTTPITLNATASSPYGPISRVDFYRNNTLAGSDNSSPYSFTNNNPPLGTNNFFAVAVDSTGQMGTSAVVTVTVLNPGVTITAPADGATYSDLTNITVSANAVSGSGTITNVSFFVDGVFFGQDATSPFSAVWAASSSGSHALTAVANDSAGNNYTSPPVLIAIAQVIFPKGSVWKYLDNGTDQGTAWQAPAFNDITWGSGPAQLGYGDGDEATVVSYGPDDQNKYVTTYFRRSFTVNNVAGFSNFVIRVQRDDGAIVYLNGAEVARFNIDPGVVSYNTLTPNATDDGANFYAATIAQNLMVEGNNVFAVEVHQSSLNSTDLSFDMDLLGVPVIVRNQKPTVTLTSPPNNSSFLSPSSIALSATASDVDGNVTNVDFLVDGVKIGQATSGTPYTFSWNSPAIGAHVLTAAASDNQGATGVSAPVNVTVYDGAGTPLVQMTSPANNAVFDGPTNLTLSATASAPNGVTNVAFYSNGLLVANDVSSPYSMVWTNAAFGSNGLVAVASSATGIRGTSAVVQVTVNAPPINTNAPVIATVTPARNSPVGALTSITVTFSERVVNVDASDLLVNGIAATGVTGTTSNYTFTFPQPAYGTVNISWAAGHGITDIGYPANLPFDATAPGASWTYNLLDTTAPTIASRNPAANATLTSLSQVSVSFSEPVIGVDAADLLVNGVPAFGVTGSGADYTFTVAQPGAGTVNISWASSHGITDLASPPNAFNATGAGATWTYLLDNRTILVQTNALWRFVKGTAEASNPSDAWRQLGYNDSSWSNALAPFYYGDTGYTNTQNPGTVLSDMQGNYSSIFLRRTFNISNPNLVSNLFLNAQSDDGFIAWINGVEVLRYDMGAGDVPYNGLAGAVSPEPNNNGAGYILYTLSNPETFLVAGTNVLTVHAFNQALATSSDFGFNAQLYAFLSDPSTVPPQVASVSPGSGEVFSLTSLTVTFTEPVTGVNASDLLINGVPATSVTGGSSNVLFTFSFAQPAYGTVSVTWAANPGILDFDPSPKAFVPGTASYQYNLVNPNAPTVLSQVPVAGASVSSLSQVSVSFSKPVTGVNASDLLVNGAPATGVSGSGANYTFTFAQPTYGTVAISWANNHGIQDQSVPANPFDANRTSATWTYTLIDQVPPVVASKVPAAGTQVTNLNQITVTFSEPVSGVNASDLLINGTPANGVSGAGATWTFTFPQPNATIVNISWANSHGIRDLANIPNNFDATGAGATWSYTTPDTLPPGVALIDPFPGITVRSLTDIRVTFTEPVVGVQTNSLLLNNQPARFVAGSGSGPYVFTFASPSNGPVEVRWVTPSAIQDLGVPPNTFPGGEWTYILDPNASFSGKVVVNEIMFNPADGSPTNEWIELKNVSTNLVNLTGWQFTKGVDFTFPNVSIAAGGYLVVAANLQAFKTRYSTVTNVIGSWTGSLGNNGNTIELSTALGEQVNSVHYATEGDWAIRERGNGPSRVLSITRNGSTATVTVFAHGFTSSDQVVITGADQPEYNGRFSLSGITASTFNITVSGTPASPATGGIAVHQVLDDGASGWSWFSPASGYGYSLELLNTALSNGSGENWSSSVSVGGTPGRANSTATNNIAPLIEEVVHTPAVPKSTDSVAITARVTDELANGVQSVTLFYRNHTANGAGSNPFSSTPMLDDGTHSDGVAGDRLFGAVLPSNANGTVIEFYVQAGDTTGHTRTWPAPSLNTNGANGTFGAPGQYANALYQVDNEVITASMPVVKTILTGTERAVFPPSNVNSDAAMNCTFISSDSEGTKVRYLADVRIRGAGSRSRSVKNNRVNIPNDNPWNGRTAINLNSQYVHAQLVGNVFAARAGLPTEEPYVVQYRMNGANPAPTGAPSGGAGWGVFLLVKPMDGDLGADHYPLDPSGNAYRASTGNHNADLTYYGTDPNTYLNRGVFKTSNKTENDWSDFIRLITALSQITNPSDYQEAIRTNVNVQEWMTYFAVCSLENDGETKLGNGIGDDYALYAGTVDKRFVIFAHDFDTVFGQGDTGASYYPINTNSSIYVMLNPPNPNGTPASLQSVLRRFMSTYAPVFYSELKRLTDTIMSPTQFNAMVDQYLPVGSWMGGGPDSSTVAAMKSYAGNRRSVVISQIPLTLTINHTLSTLNGYPSTTSPNVTLFGTSHAIDTRRVLVNGVSANWSALDARYTNTVTLQPGINRVLVQSLDSNNVEFARSTVDIWYDDSTTQTVSGTISSDTTWTANNGPYNVSASLTVASGATLTIQPGTTVYLGSGVNITIANGGRLLAEGTESAPIRFTRAPGAATSWGGIIVNGGASSPETRISYAHIEFNGSTAIHSASGTVFLDHLTFGNTAVQYLSLDSSSFIVSDCVFPSPTASFEPAHGTGGIKSGGRGIFLRNLFGITTGYNDVVDFTGGNRPGPIVQFIDNVFLGASDDILDLDSTDAWVQGNIFLHAHKNGSPDSSSAVSGGADNADTSQVTVIGNIFYDCDQVANAKQGNFYTFYNNTVVHQSHIGGTDTNGSVALLADVGTPEGAGMYFEGNIIYDAEKLVYGQTNSIVTFTNNLMQLAWSGPGGNNSNGDPLFVHVPSLSESSNFTSWAQAQVFKNWLALKSGSPATGSGPNKQDKGALVPMGASISGEPEGATSATTASLRVGINRTANGIPASGWPNGSGFTHYKWRLDGGSWSSETPINTPITLNGLSVGSHFVEVTGKNDAGFYQDDPVFGSDATVSRSRTWNVQPGALSLRLNEVLAANSGVVNHNGTTPDAIELYNFGSSDLDLTGVRLTDNPDNPDKFLFPEGTTLAAGAFLVVYANNPDATPGIHIGFSISQSGESLYLYDSADNGGVLLDSVTFGAQLANLSIGRLNDGSWGLTLPSFGSVNRGAPTGDPTRLRINEWLALSQAPAPQPFIELYNLDSAPVDMGGLYLSDTPVGWPLRDEITPLSFIAGNGYFRFICDGDPNQGSDHTSFHLDGEAGFLSLLNRDTSLIDFVSYQPQSLNVAQGRSPNGASTIVFFDQPTPGAPNPVYSVSPNGGALVINEVLANNASLAEAVGTNNLTPDWIELYNGTQNPVNLLDLSLTDDTLLPRKYVFSNSVVIPAGGFYRILSTSSLLAATNNTGFSLKSSGGGVYLFDASGNGGSLLSSIVYGLQVADFSIGRVPDGSTNWTLNAPTPGALNVTISTLGDPLNLKINEWMADPVVGENDWFEVYNPNSLPVALGGLYLTDDLNNRAKHKIAALSFIGFGTNAWLKFVADNTPLAGPDHVNFSLKATGEALGISLSDGTLIDGVTFGQQVTGVSQGRFPDGTSTLVSFPNTDSAGESNYRLLTEVVVNEVLTHTDPPLEDAIELLNLTSQAIDLSGWWLSDDKGTLQKYQIPNGTILPANGFRVIYETHFTNKFEAAIPFALSSAGDEVVLSSTSAGALTGYRTRVKFGAANNGVSFGRYITSDNQEEFIAMSARSFGVDDPSTVEQFRTGNGLPNPYPRVGPVVISQVMYHPPDLGTNDNTRDEYIQLKNISTVPVPLYDPLYPTNVWHLRNGVDFDFPTGLSLPAGGTLLVVSFDPINNPAALSAFRGYYGLSATTVIVGPWVGKLANDTDAIELRRPDSPNLADVPYVLLEKVKYGDLAPWDSAADGTGLSLQRVSLTGYANDPTNWVANIPNLEAQTSTLDSDNDGIPDTWENSYSLDPHNPADANIDSDGDGMTNLQEYRAGTNPRDILSNLRVLSMGMFGAGTNAHITFNAISNQTYSVLWKEGPAVGKWSKLADVPASAVNKTQTVTDPLPLAYTRIYRVVTPQQPGPVNPLPAILVSPSPVLASKGDNAQFSVVAIANDVANYQWLFNGSPIAWATGPVLTVTNVQFADVGLYSVVVSENGTNDASGAVALSVRPNISTQPLSQNVSAGSTVAFSVAAEGVGTLGYRWYYDNHFIAGETSATLTLNNVQAGNAGRYSVLVTHELPWGKVGVMSSNAVLNVTP